MAATQVAARAFQRSTRQSPYKMRLVVDEIRGKMVNEALAYLQFSKKHAALQISKTLRSAVANAEHLSREGDGAVDVDALYISRIVVNEGPKLKRFTPAAMGRATPIQKRTSHIEIELAEKKVPVKKAPPAAKTAAKTASSKPAAKKAAKTGRKS